MNEFRKDLRFSHESEDNPIWKTIYSIAFPGFLSMASQRKNGEMQHLGVDRTVVIESGKAVYIDEKVRREDYGDILLEYMSSDRSGSLGWCEKTLFCDYIAYAVLPSEKCYILPVPQMQYAWRKNKQKWLNKYGTKKAENPGYNTLNCPIPIKELFENIGKMFRVDYSMASL